MKILVFTDNDLDGAGSALFIKWLFNHKLSLFTVVDTTEATFTNDFKSREELIGIYDRVFILDLDLTEKQIKLVDQQHVVVVDHHIPHSRKIESYNKAKVVVKEHSSCVDLLRCKFNKLELTPAQEEIIKFIDDYDSYTLKYGDSLKLNAIHRTFNNPKTEKFIEAFEAGFRPYTIHEKNGIKLFISKFKEQLQNQVYRGRIKEYSVVSIMANYAISEVARFTINKYNADIGIVVNIDTQTVSFRKSKTCDADVSILAKTLCNGGGSASAAGGHLTKMFANLTKNFIA